ncbi:MAG: HAD family hydrolase [Pseudomonadota bacterium]
MRIAMWSGPRNLSTALMYAFGARGDCAIVDEPFYAAFLRQTGAGHPMAADVIAAHETDPLRVAEMCLAAPPAGQSFTYMKHMPHHMVPGFPLAWAETCENAHLIRHPARVIASYAAKQTEITAADISYDRQLEIWRMFGGPVISSETIRADPARALRALCVALGIPFQASMLHWPAGGRPEDGVWAAHWYAAVHASTGFAGPEGPLPKIDPKYQRLLDAAMPAYETLRAAEIRP